MISLLRDNKTEVTLQPLMTKMLEAAQASQHDEHSQLCGQETIRLINNLQHIPLIPALLHLNKEIGTMLTIFFRIGYMLGRAVETNSLTISVQRDDDDSSDTDNQNNPTHSHPSSA